jgi:hypothetical protein
MKIITTLRHFSSIWKQENGIANDELFIYECKVHTYLKMKIIIKNPAPLGDRLTKWGDYHFGAALEKALRRERPDAIIRQDYWPEWEQKDDGDLVIVLRGKRRFIPDRSVPAFLWVISHPSTISEWEISQYAIVFAGSEGFFKYVKNKSHTPVTILRQCTDTHLFFPNNNSLEKQAIVRSGLLFAANSRGYRRDIVQWSLEAGSPPQIIGGHWDSVFLGHLVEKEFI